MWRICGSLFLAVRRVPEVRVILTSIAKLQSVTAGFAAPSFLALPLASRISVVVAVISPFSDLVVLVTVLLLFDDAVVVDLNVLVVLTSLLHSSPASSRSGSARCSAA